MKTMNVQPFFVEKPWGGNFISEMFKLPLERMIGEAILVSTLPSLENTVGDGKKLSEALGNRLPYVIKLIDANENLSVQVHPNDYHAGILENSSGKTECWLISDTQVGAGVYYGLKNNVSLDQFFSYVAQGKDVSSLLNFVPVKKNDFIIVPAGTIHAIGAGVRLVEFQQCSGITYRIWDWGREGRELHIDRASKVCNENQAAPHVINFSSIATNNIFFSHTDFSLEKVGPSSLRCFSDVNQISVIFDLENYTFRLE